MAEQHSALWQKLARHSSQPSDLSAASIHWHLGKSIPWFYMTGVALGVPLLSFVPIVVFKLWLVVMWATWSLVYLWLSQRELQAHAKKFGSLTVEEVNNQIGDPWKIVIGIVIAIVMWVIGYFAHWSWPNYGLVEVTVLLISAVTAYIEKHLTNEWVLRYQAAVAGQKRYEEETRA